MIGERRGKERGGERGGERRGEERRGERREERRGEEIVYNTDQRDRRRETMELLTKQFTVSLYCTVVP